MPRHPQPLVPCSTKTFDTHLKLQATSEVGKEARNAIRENLKVIFYGVDVGMNRQRVKANSQATFIYKIDVKLDTMCNIPLCRIEGTYSLRTLARK